MDSEYLQRLGGWLDDVERRLGGHSELVSEDEALEELMYAIGTAQVAVARMLAERRRLA